LLYFFLYERNEITRIKTNKEKRFRLISHEWNDGNVYFISYQRTVRVLF